MDSEFVKTIIEEKILKVALCSKTQNGLFQLRKRFVVAENEKLKGIFESKKIESLIAENSKGEPLAILLPLQTRGAFGGGVRSKIDWRRRRHRRRQRENNESITKIVHVLRLWDV